MKALGKEYPLGQLDEMTGRKSGLRTWFSQATLALYELGLKVAYYSSVDLTSFLEGEVFFRLHFGKDAEKILQYSDVPIVTNSIEKVLEYGLFKKKKLLFEDIESHVTQGHIPLLLIDNNKIIGKSDFYQGHCVILTRFDEKHAFYHDSWPFEAEANKKVLKDTFIEAWNAPGTDNDVVMVYGKR